jgi:hypothetical protein
MVLLLIVAVILVGIWLLSHTAGWVVLGLLVFGVGWLIIGSEIDEASKRSGAGGPPPGSTRGVQRIVTWVIDL